MTESLSLTVTGMKCGGCEQKVITALTVLAGVVAVKASFAEKSVDVEFQPEQTNAELIEDTIIELGFKVE